MQLLIALSPATALAEAPSGRSGSVLSQTGQSDVQLQIGSSDQVAAAAGDDDDTGSTSTGVVVVSTPDAEHGALCPSREARIFVLGCWYHSPQHWMLTQMCVRAVGGGRFGCEHCG